MQILVLPTATLAARSISRFVVRTLQANPAAVLALPTGRTMIPVYRALVEAHRHRQVSFGRATTFNLDEFAGLAPGAAGSFQQFMRVHLFDHVNIRRECAHFPATSGQHAEDYDALIARAGGIDLCLLGIGSNGHVGFNEPAPRLSPLTHRVRLHPATRRANAYLFSNQSSAVPREAVSMGIGTIMNARAVALLATGPDKAGIVRKALGGPITTRVPASLLQVHPHALVVLDRAAAAGLPAGVKSR